MEITKYIKQQKQIYESILMFLTSDDDSYCKEETIFTNINDIIESLKITKNNDEFRRLLKLISKISKNYHRSFDLIKKIELILSHYSDEIKQAFTNSEIFKIFKNQKQILLFLFKQKILIPDKSIINNIKYKEYKYKEMQYLYDYQTYNEYEEEEMNECNQFLHFLIYFFPEMKNLIEKDLKDSIENEMKKNELNAFDDIFESRRNIGENDSLICEMIREDSVQSFIAYVNRKNLPIKNIKIKPSIFETNSILIKNEPTLIEYAAFYGSIQIFQYLNLNGVDLSPSLWLYAIHSNNADMIHILEENHIEPSSGSYNLYLKEAIKCHHNDIANYILNNLMNQNEIDFDIENNFNENLFEYSFRYSNYHFLPDNFDNKYLFFYICEFDYYTLVNLCIKHEKYDINGELILKNTNI